MERHFLFLYLDTGAGHISSARVLKSCIEAKYPGSTVMMLNGFSKDNYVGHLFFEKGYHAASTFALGAFSIIYELGKHRSFQTLLCKLVNPTTSHYIKKVILENDITDVVSFHFALAPAAVSAIRRCGRNVRISQMVTDPFTVPPAWFFERKIPYMVFSEEAKEFAVKKCKIPSENVSVVPFIINPKFTKEPTKEEISEYRKKHGIPLDKKMVLLAGGGEGLPGAVKIVNKFIKMKVDFTIAVVCGRDKATKNYLEALRIAFPKIEIIPFGFVSYMDELIKSCDCAIIKAGPATLIEVLKSKKPVIISTYMHGQELGNVRFTIRNRIGWYIRKPNDICRQINKLFSDEKYYDEIAHNLEKLEIDTDVSKIAKLVYEKD